MSVKGTECGELFGVMYVKSSVLKWLQGEYSVHASQKVDVRKILDCDYNWGSDCPNCKHALRPNKFPKEAAPQVNPSIKAIAMWHFINELIHVLSSA